jgi:hypothetical protein
MSPHTSLYTLDNCLTFPILEISGVAVGADLTAAFSEAWR